MIAETKVVYATNEVSCRLSELGLTEEILARSAQRGLAAWSDCTENHPPIFSGVSAWAETVRNLREELLPLGCWERLNEANVPLVINKLFGVAITVATGDQQTGREKGVQPCTVSPKGPRTIAAIDANNKQMMLFPELSAATVLPESKRITWLLLVHRDLENRELRCELSQPRSMAVEGHIDGWTERIILASTQFDKLPLGGLEPSQTPEIDLHIRKRA